MSERVGNDDYGSPPMLALLAFGACGKPAFHMRSEADNTNAQLAANSDRSAATWATDSLNLFECGLLGFHGCDDPTNRKWDTDQFCTRHLNSCRVPAAIYVREEPWLASGSFSSERALLGIGTIAITDVPEPFDSILSSP